MMISYWDWWAGHMWLVYRDDNIPRTEPSKIMLILWSESARFVSNMYSLWEGMKVQILATFALLVFVQS